MKVKKAIIPAAGLETRVLPASKAIPKEMLPLVDKPAIDNPIKPCHDCIVIEDQFVAEARVLPYDFGKV